MPRPLVSQWPLRRPSHSAAAAKQAGSGASQSVISPSTAPTGYACPIACVQTGQGKVVSSAADASTSASTSSDHRTALASRRFQGEGRIWLFIPRRVRLGTQVL
jgi:hypothetical protein